MLNKICPSFSLIEMLVVLLLSSIVVGMIYATFLTVSGYQHSMERKYKKLEDLSLLYFQLQKDFDRSKSIGRKDTLGIVLAYPLDKEIQYIFDPEYIVRKQVNVADTFFCATDVCEFRMRGEISGMGEMIDELSFFVTSVEPELQVSFYKQYDASSLLELDASDTIQ